MIISRAMSSAPRTLRRSAAALALLAWPLSACSGAGRQGEEAMRLYNQGKYAEALPLLQKALQGSDGKDGRLTYQVGYCREVVERNVEARQQAWQAAEPLLQAEVARENGATLERLYYLTSINASQDDAEKMVQYARQGVEQYEKGPNPNALTGEDWFRLGRMRDFLREESEAEAAYRRAVSAFARVPAQNPAYHALALIRVADIDYQSGRMAEAGEAYDRAAALLPGSPQVQPFRHALGLLALGRHEDAARRFADAQQYAGDRDPQTLIEAQYGADLARKAKEVEPLDDKDADGSGIAGLPADLLVERLKAAATALRASRDKHSYRPGDPLAAEVARDQRRFLSLLRQYFIAEKRIQEICLQNGFADLVRR
jgi:tetratricopeptide (TPR) repeat protein